MAVNDLPSHARACTIPPADPHCKAPGATHAMAREEEACTGSPAVVCAALPPA